MLASTHLFRVEIEKVEQDVNLYSKLTIKTPERQDQRCIAALSANFGQISDHVLVLF